MSTGTLRLQSGNSVPFSYENYYLKKKKHSWKLWYQCINILLIYLYIYLFGVLRSFQHCTGHITRGCCKGRGNQYIQFDRVLYCKLPTNGKQLPAFPLEAVPGTEPPASGVVGESVTTLPPWPLLPLPPWPLLLIYDTKI